MGKLICDLPGHPGPVNVDQASFDKVQQAVQNHLKAAVGRATATLGQANPKWHIIPVGPDWHITPTV
jgi:hypothetical protein